MSRLRFRTLDERKHVAERLSMSFIDEGFRHTAAPGACYRIADSSAGTNCPVREQRRGDQQDGQCLDEVR